MDSVLMNGTRGYDVLGLIEYERHRAYEGRER